MKVVVFREALAGLGSLMPDSLPTAQNHGLLYGYVHDNGEVVQVVQAAGFRQADTLRECFKAAYDVSALRAVGVWKLTGHHVPPSLKELSSAIPRSADTGKLVLLEISPSPDNHEIRAFTYEPSNPQPVPTECVVCSLENDVFGRIKDLVNIDVLSRATVAIVGVGSGGARVALELARSGVGRLLLVDPDVLEPSNIARHPCGAHDIGRHKTKAVRDLICQHNPSAEVLTYEIDVLEQREQFRCLIAESDMVVASTGAPSVNNLTNEYCLKLNKPAVYGAAWEKAMAGFAMRVIPNATACFACVHEVLLQNAPPFDSSRIVDYTIMTDARELKAEPGLSMDIGIIALIQAKLSLLVLLRGSDSHLEDIPQNYILWFNKSYDRFKPFNCLKLHVSRKADCAVCNYEEWLKRKNKELEVDTTELSNMRNGESGL